MNFFRRMKGTSMSGDAPKVTAQGIEEKIRTTVYTRLPGTTTTVCQITLVNGYVVLGTSACVSPENYDEEIGRAEAYKDALARIWPLEGYLLAQQRYEAGAAMSALSEEPPEPSAGDFGFDVALRRLRQGERVARRGWNGNGMWVTLIPAFGFHLDGFEMCDCLGLKTAEGKMQMGWLASQSDMLADDWFLFED